MKRGAEALQGGWQINLKLGESGGVRKGGARSAGALAGSGGAAVGCWYTCVE